MANNRRSRLTTNQSAIETFQKQMEDLRKLRFDKDTIQYRKQSEYKGFVQQAKCCNSLEDINTLLQKMYKAGLFPNDAVGAEIVCRLDYLGLIDEASALYNAMVLVEMTGTSIHNMMMKFAADANEIQIGKKIKENAIKLKLVTPFIYNKYFELLKNQNNLKPIYQLYGELCESKPPITDAQTHETIIMIAKDYKDLQLAQQAYQNARLFKQENTMMQTAMIKVYTNFANFNAAENIYLYAERNSLANQHTHASIIMAAGLCNNFEKALYYYNRFMAANIQHAEIYNSMILTTSKAGMRDLTYNIYNAAILANTCDFRTHSYMMEFYIANNEYDKAIQIYKNVGFSPRILKVSGFWTIDLHGLSYGAALVAMREFINDFSIPFKINIIYGRGSHSKKAPHENHGLKKAFITFIDYLRQNYQIIISEYLSNEGMARIHVQPKLENDNSVQNVNIANNENKNSETVDSETQIENPLITVVKKLQTVNPDKYRITLKTSTFDDLTTEVNKVKKSNQLANILSEMINNKNLFPNDKLAAAIIRKLFQFREIDLAITFYELMVERDIADSLTYNAMIEMMGGQNNFAYAYSVYGRAVKFGVDDKASYTLMIELAGKHGEVAIAEEVFKKACMTGSLTLTIYKNMIDGLVSNHQFERAYSVYQQSGIRPNVKTNYYRNVFAIDLSDFSYGCAYIALKQFFSNGTSPLVDIVYGNGLISSVTKEAVQRVITELQLCYDVSWAEHEAMIRLQLQPKQTFYNMPANVNTDVLFQPNISANTPPNTPGAENKKQF